jgi:hypothetical protein
VWWYTSIIPALGRMRQKDGEFKAKLGYSRETLPQKNHPSLLIKIIPMDILETKCLGFFL